MAPSPSPFRFWIRRGEDPDLPFSLRYEVSEGRGVLRVSRSSVLVDPPARERGYAENLGAVQVRSSRFLHVAQAGRRRLIHLLSRLRDADLERLPLDEWHELEVIESEGFRYLHIELEARAVSLQGLSHPYPAAPPPLPFAQLSEGVVAQHLAADEEATQLLQAPTADMLGIAEDTRDEPSVGHTDASQVIVEDTEDDTLVPAEEDTLAALPADPEDEDSVGPTEVYISPFAGPQVDTIEEDEDTPTEPPATPAPVAPEALRPSWADAAWSEAPSATGLVRYLRRALDRERSRSATLQAKVAELESLLGQAPKKAGSG